MQVRKASEIKQLDEDAKRFGIDGCLLMEHAAMQLKQHLDQQFQHLDKVCVGIVCGSGNNGGDGFALARLLQFDHRYEVQLYCAIPLQDLHGEAKQFAQLVKQLEISWLQSQDQSIVDAWLNSCNIIVDCLFGIGLNRGIEGWNAQLIQCINAQKAYVLACDIPSGIESDTGHMLGCAIKADATITFTCGKLGLYVNEGRTCAGNITIVDITIPQQWMELSKDTITLLDDAWFQSHFPTRSKDGHKGSFKKGLIIGGQLGMSGAVVMAAEGAMRCGIGTISVMVPKEAQSIMAFQCYEMMTLSIPMHGTQLDKDALKTQLEAYDVIAFGNGMGRGELTKEVLEVLWNCDKPCVFDGDALMFVPAFAKKKRISQTVLTPHPKEVSYLLGISTREVLKNPSETLKTLNKTFPRCTVVCKDANTLITEDGVHALNTAGNDGLAHGGSGDVLCGMTLAFLANQGVALHAACLAVMLHARCAETLAKQMSTHAILPRDILHQIGYELQKYKEKEAVTK